jgi:heat shock protein HslJ
MTLIPSCGYPGNVTKTNQFGCRVNGSAGIFTYPARKKMKTLRISIITLILVISVCACVSGRQAVTTGIENTTWVLTSINDKRPLDGARPTIQFNDGQLSGRAGCNAYGGSYQIEGDAISFRALFSTEMACMDPEGVMEQERTFLDLLQTATRFELDDGVLTIFVGERPSMMFEMRSDSPAIPTSTLIPSSPTPITTTATLEVIEPTQTPTFEPPAGYKEYRDSVAGISINIPENWYVTGVIDGQYAIFQSYPEDKYVGGERREPGDTKCDLNLRPSVADTEELIQLWQNDPRTDILSEDTFVLESGLPGRRFVIDSLGQATVFVTELNQGVVTLTCFGDFTLVDEIAVTINENE